MTSSNRRFSPFVNPDPPEQAIDNLRRIVEFNVGNYRMLAHEPPIARVMTSVDSENEKHITYVVPHRYP